MGNRSVVALSVTTVLWVCVMNRAMHRTLLRPSPADRRWLIFAVFGAPVMWALNQTVGLTVVGHGCHRLGKAGLTGVAGISGMAKVRRASGREGWWPLGACCVSVARR